MPTASPAAITPPDAVVSLVLYQNPWSPVPNDCAGLNAGVGVNVFCSNAAGYIMVARLMQGNDTIVAACAALSETQLVLTPPYPLAEDRPYYVQVQLVPNPPTYNQAAIIASVDWTAANTASTPALASILELTEGMIEIGGTPSNPTLSATFSWANHFPITAYVQIFPSPSPLNTHLVSCSNNSISLSYDYSNPSAPFTVVLRPLMPITTPPAVWPPNTLSWKAPSYSAGSGIAYILPTQSPTIASVNYDGTTVSVAWSALTIPDGAEPVSYELLLNCTGSNSAATAKVFPASSTGGTAPLAMPGSLSETYTVSVRVNYGVIKGPLSQEVPVITGTVNNIVQATDASTGIATLTWADASGFNTENPNYTGYTETFNLAFSSGSPALVTGNSGTRYVLPAQLAPNTVNAVSVSVTATSGTVTTAGPSSPWRKLGTSQPVLLGAEYDGNAISLSWQALDDRVREYTITLFYKKSAHTTLTVNTTVCAPAGSTTSLTFAPVHPVASTDALTVTLQASLTDDAGPGLPALYGLSNFSCPMPVSFTPAYFLAATGQTTTAPLIYTAPVLANLDQAQPEPITLYLPYTSARKTLSLPVQYPSSSPVFSLTANPAANSNSAQYPYTLTIDSSAWNAKAIRASVQTAYIEFLKAAEKAGVSPWGISVIQEAIARHMPQTFAETLYYNYGLDLAKGYADLRPGMVLRVMPSDFMAVPGYDRNGNAMNYLNGYTNSAPLDYDINSYYAHDSNWLLGFDAFISQLVAGGALTVNAPPTRLAPNVGGIAEAADLYSPLFLQPFYRLFFPTTLLTPTGPGSTEPSSQFNLAAAASYSDLDKTTNTAANNAYFRGRAVIKLCIRVTVNGNESVVPIGTTVAHILERAGRMPPKSAIRIEGLSLERAIGQSDSFGNASCQAGRSYAVRFDSQALTAYGNGQSALDLPLLHGDILTFGA